MTVEERLEALEKELAFLKGKQLSVKKLFIENEEGIRVAEISAESKGASLIFRDIYNKIQMIVGSDESGPLIVFYNKNQKIRMFLGVNPHGAGFSISDKNGNPRIDLFSKQDGPLIEILDKKGKERFSVRVGDANDYREGTHMFLVGERNNDRINIETSAYSGCKISLGSFSIKEDTGYQVLLEAENQGASINIFNGIGKSIGMEINDETPAKLNIYNRGDNASNSHQQC